MTTSFGRVRFRPVDLIEHSFDDERMLDVAIRRVDGTRTVDPALLSVRATPPLPVSAALSTVLPGGLRRGSTVVVSGSVSLLLALLGEASAGGAWCALVGFPRISAEAASEYGIELSRLAIIPPLTSDGLRSEQSRTGASWTTAVGALLDALDVVAARPPRLVPGDVRRLAARARNRDAVLVPYLTGDADWPGADVRLSADEPHWTGIGDGTGRLVARQVHVHAQGRGTAARPREATLWLPAHGGGIDVVTPVAPVIDLAG